jgi:hypothetical protein
MDTPAYRTGCQAPSSSSALTPVRPGDRVKTNRRDAENPTCYSVSTIGHRFIDLSERRTMRGVPGNIQSAPDIVIRKARILFFGLPPGPELPVGRSTGPGVPAPGVAESTDLESEVGDEGATGSSPGGPADRTVGGNPRSGHSRGGGSVQRGGSLCVVAATAGIRSGPLARPNLLHHPPRRRLW